MRDGLEFQAEEEPLLRIDAWQCQKAPLELYLDSQERLAAAPASKVRKQKRIAAVISGPGASANDYSWWLIPRSAMVSINGVQPFPLAALDRGVLLTFGGHRWLVASQWAPTPCPAPQSVANRDCPVCGGALSLAPVIQCPCGRYYHLENPGDADNPGLLNCYLSGACGMCGREPSLKPQLLPTPDEKLLGIA